jgi:hypothetical protein
MTTSKKKQTMFALTNIKADGTFVNVGDEVKESDYDEKTWASLVEAGAVGSTPKGVSAENAVLFQGLIDENAALRARLAALGEDPNAVVEELAAENEELRTELESKGDATSQGEANRAATGPSGQLETDAKQKADTTTVVENGKK